MSAEAKNSNSSSEKSEKKTPKNTAKWYKHWMVLGTIGIWLGVVTVSVAYLAITVWLGMDSMMSRIMCGIAASFVGSVLLYVFSVVVYKTFK